MYYRAQPSRLKGTITVPPSKSHTLRAIIFASLATGKSIITNYLHSPDTKAMLNACQQLGANITVEQKQLTVIGTDGRPQAPDNIIDAGNSGQVLRFVAAVAALAPGYTVITGDHSIRTNRPILPLLEGLAQLDVFAVSTKENGFAPIIIKGPLRGGRATLCGEDSQPVSGLLIACAFAQNNTLINVTNPGERPWVDLTLDWFKRLGIDYQQQDHSQYKVGGQAKYSGFLYTVPGDFSSCAFPLVGALITQSEIVLKGLDMEDVQGDKELIYTLQKMGASIGIDRHNKTIDTKKSQALNGSTIEVNNYIDAVPILAVMGCFAAGETLITGAAIARKKECDRLSAITHELKKMGAQIITQQDGLLIKPSVLTGTKVSSHNDHRIAMALAVAGLSARGETIIENTDCVDKSFPGFIQALQELGAVIEAKT